MTAPVPAGIVEAAAKAIYDSWWEDGEQFESARWENLEPDDYDRVSALKAARVALAAALPVLLADVPTIRAALMPLSDTLDPEEGPVDPPVAIEVQR